MASNDIDIEEHELTEHPRFISVFPGLNIKEEPKDDYEKCDVTVPDEIPDSTTDAVMEHVPPSDSPQIVTSTVDQSIGHIQIQEAFSLRDTHSNSKQTKAAIEAQSLALETDKTDEKSMEEDPSNMEVDITPQDLSDLRKSPKETVNSHTAQTSSNSETTSCDIKLKNLSSLLERKPYCSDCHTSFRHHDLLIEHKLSHHSNTVEGSVATYCKKCERNFPDLNQLIEHIYHHLQSAKKPTETAIKPTESVKKTTDKHNKPKTWKQTPKSTCYSCKICFNKFFKSGSLIAHMMNNHKISVANTDDYLAKDTSSVCGVCGWRLGTIKSMRHHIRLVHRQQYFQVGTRVFKKHKPVENFDSDERSAATRSSDSESVESVCDSNRYKKKTEVVKKKVDHTSRLVCKICKIASASEMSLKSHIVANHNFALYSDVVFDCASCGNHFANLRLYKRHKILKSCKLSSLQCDTCQVPMDESNLPWHTYWHKFNPNLKPIFIDEQTLNSKPYNLFRCVRCDVYHHHMSVPHVCNSNQLATCKTCSIQFESNSISHHTKLHKAFPELTLDNFFVIDHNYPVDGAKKVQPKLTVKIGKPFKEQVSANKTCTSIVGDVLFQCNRCLRYMFPYPNYATHRKTRACGKPILKKCKICSLEISTTSIQRHLAWHSVRGKSRPQILTAKMLASPKPLLFKCAMCKAHHKSSNHTCSRDLELCRHCNLKILDSNHYHMKLHKKMPNLKSADDFNIIVIDGKPNKVQEKALGAKVSKKTQNPPSESEDTKSAESIHLFKCDRCSVHMFVLKNFDEHITTRKCNPKDTMVCKECSLRFYFGAMAVHKQHHSDGVVYKGTVTSSQLLSKKDVYYHCLECDTFTKSKGHSCNQKGSFNFPKCDACNIKLSRQTHPLHMDLHKTWDDLDFFNDCLILEIGTPKVPPLKINVKKLKVEKSLKEKSESDDDSTTKSDQECDSDLIQCKTCFCCFKETEEEGHDCEKDNQYLCSSCGLYYTKETMREHKNLGPHKQSDIIVKPCYRETERHVVFLCLTCNVHFLSKEHVCRKRGIKYAPKCTQCKLRCNATSKNKHNQIGPHTRDDLMIVKLRKRCTFEEDHKVTLYECKCGRHVTIKDNLDLDCSKMSKVFCKQCSLYFTVSGAVAHKKLGPHTAADIKVVPGAAKRKQETYREPPAKKMKLVKKLYSSGDVRIKLKRFGESKFTFYVCEHCDRHFTERKLAKFHARKDDCFMNELNKCTVCPFKCYRMSNHIVFHEKHPNLTYDMITIYTFAKVNNKPASEEAINSVKQENDKKIDCKKNNSINIRNLVKKKYRSDSNWRRLFKCHLCQRLVHNHRSLARHLNNHIFTKYVRDCSICNLKFTVKGYTLHEKMHKRRPNLSRDDFEFYDIDMVPVDVEVSSKSEGSADNNDKDAADMSSEENEAETNEAYKCQLCEIDFGSLKYFKEHLESKDDTNCPICGAIFDKHESKIEHLSVDKGSYVCCVCTIYQKVEYLSVHAKIHVGSYECVHCDSRFDNVTDLDRHLQNHFK